MCFAVKPHLYVSISARENAAFLFQKFWELAKQVSEFMTWKKVECPFEKDRKILQYLLTAPAFTEDGKRHIFKQHLNNIQIKWQVAQGVEE